MGEATYRWAGLRDAPTLSMLLSTRFAHGSRKSRVRFFIKLVTTPHLTTSERHVVVGFVPSTPRARPLTRLLNGLRWLIVMSGEPCSGMRVPDQLAQALTWRGVNLASSTGTTPSETVALALFAKHLADRAGVEVVLDVPRGNERLRRIYMRHGFLPSDRPDGMRRRLQPDRAPDQPATDQHWDCVLRTGRLTLDGHLHRFGELSADARILDVGAGDSPFCGQLMARGNLAVMVDPQYSHQPPFSAVAVAAVAEALPFAGGAFSNVIASFALMHVPAPARTDAVRELLRVCDSGGTVRIWPLWRAARAKRALATCPNVAIRQGSVLPRRRAELCVGPGSALMPAWAHEVIARHSGPSPMVTRLTYRAMGVLRRVRTTTKFDTRRLTLRRAQVGRE